MNVLHVLDFSPPFAGSMVGHLTALGDALRARGDRLLVALPRERAWFDELSRSAAILIVPEIRHPLRSGFLPRYEAIRRQEGVHVAHFGFSFALALVVAMAGRRPRTPTVYHWHSPPRPLRRVQGRSRLFPWPVPAGAIARFADRHAIDAHVTVSREIRDLLVANRWAAAEKIVVQPNALPKMPDPGFGGGVPAVSRERGGPVIGSIAAFRPQKDHATLLHAFAMVQAGFPSSRLILVGDGPTRAAMIDLATRLGLEDKVEFTRMLADTSAAYRRFDVFALSTHYEGQGLVLLEAMGHAVPIVATDLPVIRETLREGTDALLVAPGDPAALATALSRLLGDAALRERLGASGRRRVEEEFAISPWCNRMLRLYDALRSGQTPG